MAEALFRNLIKEEGLADTYEVHSAGTSAYFSSCASDNAILALKDMNIDITSHRSKMLTEKMITEADLILTMTNNHKRHILSIVPNAAEKVFTIKEYSDNSKHYDISDPFGGDIHIYRHCRDEILGDLIKIIEKLKKEEYR